MESSKLNDGKRMAWLAVIGCLIAIAMIWMALKIRDRRTWVPRPAPTTVLLCSAGKEWLVRKEAALFLFNDSEWKTLISAYPDRLTNTVWGVGLWFEQGTAVRATKEMFEKARKLDGTEIRSNVVWFTKP